jgi:RNA polymerase sigma-70 factor, ECF subfamily
MTESGQAPASVPLGKATSSDSGRTGRASEDPWTSLVARMAVGDQEALARLFDETGSLVYGLSLRMLRNREDADEILLDVYGRAWRNAATFDPNRGSVRSWLVMMARSLAIDRIRAGAARVERVEAFSDQIEATASGDDPEAATDQRRARDRIRAALSQLPAEQRETVELAFFSGYTHSELAGVLGQPLGTVKTRIRLGLIRLRELLKERR